MNASEISTAAPAIAFNEVKIAFGRKEVLRGMTASARPGRVVGLLGRNGEGKTTLFRILLDMLQPDSGTIELLGHRPDGSGAIRQLAGWVPERPVFHEFMTVRDVFFWRSRFFKNWKPARAAQLAKELELDPATKIKGASKGTLAKIAWVCAVAHEPQLLLLDEPTSGLDALVREEVLTHLIRELMSAGRTILVANHHMEELAGVLDEVWVMHGGRITSVHELDDLRAGACRITGRLRDGAVVPADLQVIAAGDNAPLVNWQVLDAATREKIRALELLDGMECQPLPIEAALKALLAQKSEGVSHV